MFIKQAIIYLICGFVGYLIGRTGHVFGGDSESPHHWIYGLGIVILGLFFKNKFWGVPLMFFGMGVFVSDLIDFLHLRFYGKDTVEVVRFWGFD